MSGWNCRLAGAVLLVALGGAPAALAERVSVLPVPGGGRAPSAEIDENGVIHLVYVANEDLFYVRSADDGRTFSAPVRVNGEAGTVAAGAYRTPDLGIGRGGRVHVVWYSDAHRRGLSESQLGVRYAHHESSSAGFSPTRNLGERKSDNFSVAAEPSGNVAILWTANGLFVRRSKDGGETFAEPQRIDAVDPCECCATRARFGERGKLDVLYRDRTGNVRDVFLLALEAGATPESRLRMSETAWPLDVCPMSGESLGRDSRGLVAAWETETRVSFARLDASGEKLPPGEIVAPGRQRKKYPLALRAGDGTTLLAWKSGRRLQWQVYDSRGAAQGDPGSRDSPTPQPPSGVVLRDGRFVLFD